MTLRGYVFLVAVGILIDIFASTNQQSQSAAGSTKAVDDIEGDTGGSHLTPNLGTFSLARVTDDIVRDLRSKDVPAERWATFVHVGI